MNFDELKKTSLLGLERSNAGQSLFEDLESMGIALTGDAAHDLLCGLGALYLSERAAAKLPIVEAKTIPPPSDERDATPISDALFQDFEVLAAGVYPEALPVFLKLMVEWKLRFQHRHLPKVLDRCKKNHHLFRALQSVLDGRARWLMELNPEWRPLLRVKLDKENPMLKARPDLDEKERAKVEWFIEKMTMKMQL